MNKDRKEPIFYDANAILKNNVDDNGLYLNDELGYKGYTSPYYGVSDIDEKSFIARVHIKEEFYKEMLADSRISVQVARGVVPANVLESNSIARMYVHLGSYNDPRDAAYIVQMYAFSEDSYELIVKLLLDRYVEKIDPLNNIVIPNWEYKAVGREYDPKDGKYKPSKQQLEEAKSIIDAKKAEIEKAKVLEDNKKRLLDKWLKAGYTEDTFNDQAIKLIISGKLQNNK